jgi:hypothetical protein
MYIYVYDSSIQYTIMIHDRNITQYNSSSQIVTKRQNQRCRFPRAFAQSARFSHFQPELNVNDFRSI